MKKLLMVIMVLGMASTAHAQLYGNYQGFCQSGGKPVVTQGMSSSTLVQASYPGCTVTVYAIAAPTVPIALASDGTGTPLTNPFTANADGSFQFYALQGLYPLYVTISGGGMPTPATFTVQPPFSPLNTARLNTLYLVGSTQYQTIQSAVTAACASGTGTVQINFGVTPPDVPTGVTGGCAGVEILTATGQTYTWNGTAYVQISTLDVRSYGASCDWNGTTGTDNTAAFAAASTVATAHYAATGYPTQVMFSGNCMVSSTITHGSGVHWFGLGGQIIVPNQVADVFYAVNANDVSWDYVKVTALANNQTDSPVVAGIGWGETTSDGTSYSNVKVRNCTLNNTVWGVSIFYTGSGSGSLTDVDVSGNTVTAPTVYAVGVGDGIHVGGRVSGITIDNNRLINRSDGAISLTSESFDQVYVLSGATISNNVLLNDRVGIDISGAQNVVVTGNYVRATVATSTPNPAMRMILYGLTEPVNTNVYGNYFENGVGNSATVTVDPAGNGFTGPLNINIKDNTLGGNNGLNGYTAELAVRGNTIILASNTLPSGGEIFVDYYAPGGATASVPTMNVLVGKNYWQGTGTVFLSPNVALQLNVQIDTQQAVGAMTYLNSQYATLGASTVQTAFFGGCNFASGASGINCSTLQGFPYAFPSTNYLVSCSLMSTFAFNNPSLAPAITTYVVVTGTQTFTVYEAAVVGNAAAWASDHAYAASLVCTANYGR